MEGYLTVPNEFNKVGTSMLQMDEIEEYLKAKQFAKKSDKVKDVENVAGIPANRIAVAVSTADRETVNNAMHFDGKTPKDFVSAKEGAGLLKNVDSIKNTYNEEIAGLRDELYQLRQELAKSGIAQRYDAYEGYYDTFRATTPTHLDGVIATAIEDSRANAARSSIKIVNSLYDYFNKGDYILIRSRSSLKSNIVQITEMKPDHQTIMFSPETEFSILADDAEIFRSKGSIINGSYTFGDLIPVRPGTKELYTALDDDTHWSLRQIKKNNTGFAYTFRIPTAYQRNYLAKLQIKVKKYGQPGPLKCYIINERDVDNWKNPIKAREDDIIIAESLPLQVESRYDMHLAEFSFFDPRVNVNTLRDSTQDPSSLKALEAQINANPKNYPLLEEYDDQGNSNEKIRYCMIIEGMSNHDDSNYHELTFIGHTDMPSQDLQINNMTYEYTERTSASSNAAMKTNDVINAADIYYGITLIEAIKEKFVPYSDGLYTARFKTNSTKGASRARLTMRIGREGIFNITGDAGTPGFGDFNDGGTFTVRGQDVYDVDGFKYVDDKYIAIGDQFRETQAVTNNTISIRKGLHIEPNAPVYPIGYKVAIKAKQTRWNADTCHTDVLAQAKYEMPLVDIAKDVFKKDESISDRLIFETTFLDSSKAPIYYNEFEIEIRWTKSCRETNAKLTGKIEDLVVSLDQSL